MLLFEILRHCDDLDTYYEYHRIREETLLTLEIKSEVFLSREAYREDFKPLINWCNHNSKGLITAPLFIGSLVCDDEYLEKLRNGNINLDDTFSMNFTNLNDAMVVKLMLGDFLEIQGVWIEDPSDGLYRAKFNPIHDLAEILLYRPNAVLDI